jgi:RNA:NAD 2'-phosphotransferase (TPT1/KptA family)
VYLKNLYDFLLMNLSIQDQKSLGFLLISRWFPLYKRIGKHWRLTHRRHSMCLWKCTYAKPPQILWHGTSADSLRSIKESGIDKRTRLYVHLSDSVFQVQAVGKRHGVPIVLGVMAGAMFDAGYKFYRSRNGVWLTDYVPPQYIWVRNTHY